MDVLVVLSMMMKPKPAVNYNLPSFWNGSQVEIVGAMSGAESLKSFNNIYNYSELLIKAIKQNCQKKKMCDVTFCGFKF